MEQFGKFVLSSLIGGAILFWGAFVTLQYWNWFAEPIFQTGWNLTYVQMAGLSLFFGCFFMSKRKFFKAYEEEKDKSYSDQTAESIVYAIILLLVWGFGWVYSLFIT